MFLAGEGRNELGCWYDEPPHRVGSDPGVIEALLRGVQSEGWHVSDALRWTRIRKLRLGRSVHADVHNILAVALHARERGCDVLAFARDTDGEEERERAVAKGIAAMIDDPGESLGVVGGAAVPNLEAWILALHGGRSTDRAGRARVTRALKAAGIAPKDTAAMVAVVERANLEGMERRSKSLATWLGTAKEVLRRRVEERALTEPVPR